MPSQIHAVLAVAALCASPLLPQGAQQLGDLAPGPNGSYPSWAGPGTVGLDVAFTTSSPRRLWRTDGAASHTFQVSVSTIGNAISLGDRFLFIGPSASPATHLFAARTGDAPPTLLRQFVNLQIQQPGVLGPLAVFVADDGISGHEPWVTDGTIAGTRQLGDLNPGSGGSQPQRFTRIGHFVYFFTTVVTGDHRLWRTDGNSLEAMPGVFDNGLHKVGAAGEKLFLAYIPPSTIRVDAYDPATGTSTNLVTWLPSPRPPHWVDTMFALGDRMLFEWKTDAEGTEPWISDGTKAGTRMIVDLEPGRDSSFAKFWPTGVAQLALLVDKDRNIYATDGTQAGTRLLLSPGQYTSPALAAADDRTLFMVRVRPGQTSDVYETDGTTAGTKLFVQAVHAQKLHLGKALYAFDDGVTGFEPWSIPVWPTALQVGRGCGEGHRIPTLHATTPHLGAPITFRGDGAPAGSHAMLLVGPVSDPPVRLDSAHGCVLELRPTHESVAHAFVPDGDAWSWTTLVPNMPSLQGHTLAAQVWFHASTPPTSQSTNGVHLTFGR